MFGNILQAASNVMAPTGDQESDDRGAGANAYDDNGAYADDFDDEQDEDEIFAEEAAEDPRLQAWKKDENDRMRRQMEARPIPSLAS